VTHARHTPPHDDPDHPRARSTGTGLRKRALPFTPAVEDYVTTLYRLKQQRDAPVATGAIATRLEVSAPSASNMVRDLAQLGLVTVIRRPGARLTPSGRELARSVVRRHRIIECFLKDALDLPWDSVHDEADLLDHAVSTPVSEAMWEVLGRPVRDPHGDPITPPGDDDPDTDILEPLDTCEPDAAGMLVRGSDAQADALRYMSEHRIAPGLPIHVISREPFGVGQRVLIGGTQHIIGPELGRLMFIDRAG
jgi:DtxR family Mn-dependent transcriptional regulator